VRIAIDARMIQAGSMHGIARYVYQLIKNLRRIDDTTQFFLLVGAGSPLFHEKWPVNFHLIKVRARWISFREQIELPRVLRSIKADLLHAPSFVAPLFTSCKLVMTIHDLNHMVLPQFYTVLHQFYYQFFVRRCIQRSELIFTVSQFSKTEIVRNLGLAADKIHVTYNGVSENFRPVKCPETLEYIRDLYELPERFIFCLTNNKPHKNVHQLVRAYCVSSVAHPLVLACPVDIKAIQIAENYGKKHLLYFTRFIDEKDLPAVYSMTDLFVYPSTYEGFGLPPLEALSCGAKVVVARASSLPEVVDKYAIYTNPHDYKDIARALEVGLGDKTPDHQNIEAINYARGFTWQEMAQKTYELYQYALDKRSPAMIDSAAEVHS
jgi:glycosyltransferase involved in cell wall biosynthesis